jgi:hypothetical protein
VRLPEGWRGKMRDYYDLVYYSRPPFCTNTICLPASLANKTPFPLGIKAGEDLLVWFQVSLEHETAYLNECHATYYVEVAGHAHDIYFGPKHHLDWLAMGKQLKTEGKISEPALKFTVWASLVQVRKMITNGQRNKALEMLGRCPRHYFPIYQAFLLFMALSPRRYWKNIKPELAKLGKSFLAGGSSHRASSGVK